MTFPLLSTQLSVTKFQEPEMVPVNIDCPGCAGSGEVEGLSYVGLSFSGPYEGAMVPCGECKGKSYITVERCEACNESSEECQCSDWQD